MRGREGAASRIGECVCPARSAVNSDVSVSPLGGRVRVKAFPFSLPPSLLASPRLSLAASLCIPSPLLSFSLSLSLSLFSVLFHDIEICFQSFVAVEWELRNVSGSVKRVVRHTRTAAREGTAPGKQRRCPGITQRSVYRPFTRPSRKPTVRLRKRLAQKYHHGVMCARPVSNVI